MHCIACRKNIFCRKLIYVVQFFLPFLPFTPPQLGHHCQFGGIGGRQYMELNLNDGILFQKRVTGDAQIDGDNLVLLLRLLVVLVHLPEESVWDQIKKRNNPLIDVNVKYRQPFSNSMVVFLRHILHFTCCGTRNVRGNNPRKGMPVSYPTARKTMEALSSYLTAETEQE